MWRDTVSPGETKRIGRGRKKKGRRTRLVDKVDLKYRRNGEDEQGRIGDPALERDTGVEVDKGGDSFGGEDGESACSPSSLSVAVTHMRQRERKTYRPARKATGR